MNKDTTSVGEMKKKARNKIFAAMLSSKPGVIEDAIDKEAIEIYAAGASAMLQRVREGVEKHKRNNWRYAGGGGVDTEVWSLNGVCVSLPGIRQIAFYGVRNKTWWARYMFRELEVKPKAEYNKALADILSHLDTLQKEIEGNKETT